MYLRSKDFILNNRFHYKQDEAWLGYRSGKDGVLDWGRRSGKSDLLAELFIEDIEEYGKDCLYLALTIGQAREILWPKLVERLVGNSHWKSNEARLEWTYLPSKAILSLKGSDIGKHRLRGSGKRLIGLDEFAFYRDPTIVKDVIVPMLADYNGQLIYCSSPNGKNHFYTLKQRALKNPEKFFTSSCTMFDNPFIPDAGRQKLIEEYTGSDDPLYRQEILGEYVVLEGMAFALPQDSYIEKVWDRADLDHSFHWRGFDHGYSPDPTACVWIAYNKRKGYFQIYNEYKQSKLLIHQHAEAIGKLEQFRFVDTYSDVDPQLIAEYNDVGFIMNPAQKHDKNSRILRLVNALKTGKLKIASHCTMLLDEMQNYQWEQDGNDHLIDAMNYGFTNLTIPELTKHEDEDPPPRRISMTYEDNFTNQSFGDE